MIFREKHRIVQEIEKRRQKGQVIQFLTGDAISASDNYLYDFYWGVQSLDKTLMLYYFKEKQEFDFFIHVVNSNQKMICYAHDETSKMGCREIDFAEMMPKPKRRGLFQDSQNVKRTAPDNAGSKNADKTNETVQNQVDTANDIQHKLGRLTEQIKKGDKQFLILLENMEWIANLYDEPDTTWIAQLQDPHWKRAKKLLVLTTIKDMDLLKKYSFAEEEIFIANPTANEIFLAYWRYILKNSIDHYKYSLNDLDEIAHSMSVGKKSLVQCMRVLRNVYQGNNSELSKEDFAKCAEQSIEEKIAWEDVLLEKKVKDQIERAIKRFEESADNEDGDNSARKGFILTGPPGTGKTMIAKALANKYNFYFMSPTLADLKGEYVGQSSAKVKRIFAEARGNQPTILFIDEADTVFPSRSLNTGDRDSFGLDMVNQFLQELDGAKTGKQKIFTIAATNRIEVVDPAIRSRLSDTPIKIPLPSFEMREKMFNQKLKPFTLDNKPFRNFVLEKSENMSGRDIDNLTKKIKELGEWTEISEDDTKAAVLFARVFSERENAFVDENKDLNIFSEIISYEDNKDILDNIIGYESLKKEINKQVDYIVATDEEKRRYDSYGIVPAKGVIMYGPPGNAKTKLAQAVAGENKFYFFKVLSQDFASALPEQQIKRLKEIFEKAEKFSKMMNSKGLVLFFDEIDSLVGKDVLNPIVRGTMLDYIANESGIRAKDSKILFMCATNFYNKIDEAIKRKGRIDTHLFMDNPTVKNGIEILNQFFIHDEKVENPNEETIKVAYDKLTEAKQKDPERRKQVIYELFGNAEIFERLGSRDKNIVEDKINEIRPSGSDLRILYNQLKESAFLKSKYNNNGEKKLLIDLDLVNEFFSVMGI